MPKAHQTTTKRRDRPQRRRDLPQHDKQCASCGCKFTTHKSKARRCDECLATGKRAVTRTCLECRKQFPLIDEDHVNCEACAEMLGVFQCELTPEQRAKLLEAENRARHRERLENQNEWLARREAAPKGYQKMNQRTAATPLGVLWLQLCAADGAAASLMYAAKSTDLDEDGKVQLLMTFYRLRAKGYHPSAVAKLCPRAILKDATQAALSDLPRVTEPEPVSEATSNDTTTEDWGRVALTASLGLRSTGISDT